MLSQMHHVHVNAHEYQLPLTKLLKTHKPLCMLPHGPERVRDVWPTVVLVNLCKVDIDSAGSAHVTAEESSFNTFSLLKYADVYRDLARYRASGKLKSRRGRCRSCTEEGCSQLIRRLER